MNQFEIYNKIGKETELLSLNNHVPLKLNMFEVLNNIPQCNLMTETKVKNGFKFITSKRGRKNKNIEKDKEIVNKSLKNKVEHNKYCNDNVRRKIKTLYHKYIIQLLNDLIKKKYKNIRMKFVKMDIRNTKDISIEFNRY